MDDGYRDKTRYPEDPGPYCFPPVATSITAAARLTLALIERTLGDTGGSFAFMDTDSIAIVATPGGGPMPCVTDAGDSITALSHEQVRELLRRFEPLNPYGPDVINDDPSLGRSPWKVEKDSLNQSVWCYAIASKRYLLYRHTDNGPDLIGIGDDEEESSADSESAPEGDGAFVAWSEHGLGLYVDPTDDQARDDQGRRSWIRDAWSWILTTALSGDRRAPKPPWAARYALSQFSVSTPRQSGWFNIPVEGSPQPEKPRAFGFGLLGHVDPFSAQWVTARPAAPYSSKPQLWPVLPWYDRHTGQPLQVYSGDDIADHTEQLFDAFQPGHVPLRTIGNVMETHDQRPEHKSLSPEGGPAGETTTGRLRRRAVRAAPVLTAHIGKEGHRLLERATGEITDPADYRTTYARADTGLWRSLTLPVLHDIRDELGTAYIAERVGLSARQVRNWLNGPDEPHAGASGNRQRVEKLAVTWATEQLQVGGRAIPNHPNAVLYAFLRHG